METLISPVEAATLERQIGQELARRNLLDYIKLTNPKYRVAPHHWLLCQVGQLVEWGIIARLINELPPRHGKSQIFSVHFPAWHLGRHPDHQVISASYAQELSDDFSYKVRAQFRDDTWPFPNVKLASDAYRVTEWHVSGGGQYRSAGRGAGITGKGAHLLNLDDLIKDDAEAASQTIRDAAWRFVTTTAMTRLMPGATVVATGTRWHDNDPLGRFQAQARQGGEQWFVVTLPALHDGADVWARVQVPDDLALHAGIQGPTTAEALVGRLMAIGHAQTEPARLSA